MTLSVVFAVVRRVRFAVVAIGLSVGIGACTALPGDGPWMGGAQTTSTEALPFDVIDLTPTTIAAYGPTAPQDRPSQTGNLSAAVRLVAAPGDSLRVRISERYAGNIFPTIAGLSADLGIQRVAADGHITVPYVGDVQVSGLDLNQIEQRIIQQLGSKVQEPEVIVEFDAPRTYSVAVSGDVKQPGRVSILDDVRSVAGAINKAGGPAGLATSNQVQVVVRRGGQIILTTQFSDLLAGDDIPLQKGDEIVVRPNNRVFTALGAVQKAGNVEMTKKNFSLIEGLGMVGGLLDPRANKTGVYVFRMGDLSNNPAARSRIFRLDLFQPVALFIGQQFILEPRDVIYVTNAPLYEYDKILTALYRTISILTVASGNTAVTTSF